MLLRPIKNAIDAIWMMLPEPRFTIPRDCLHHKECTLEVDGHHAVPFRFGDVEKGPPLPDTRVVEKYVDPAKMRDGSSDGLVNLLLVSDVSPRGPSPPSCRA
jgi:hypothetical protein